ncbi:hypothetical protein [Paraburkholderia bryophila]|uniref:Uncharacterized protein n=1 Tax=Paraburkholderia bryophila TaxID=420952 RepID=A0A7Z0B373_9BURK|nr:hypothetical protein [Paraburkholderia bryophila]NYH18783.1 hypothetical protein [Paraburkholderia bryophila]
MSLTQKILDAPAAEMPDDFPRETMAAALPGVQIKLGVRLINGQYVAETAEERYERWLVCEDLAQQLVAVARKDEGTHPGQTRDRTLEHVRVSVARKRWGSPAELDWLMRRLCTLLANDGAQNG